MSEQVKNKDKIVIVSGPSGVGKSTICKKVAKRLDKCHLSVSVTTRPRSDGEVDGQDYWFISEEELQKQINRGALLEYAEVFGNMYGTPKDKVQEALKEDKIVILEIDVQGANPSQRELAERMNGRAREDPETAEKRLDIAGSEIASGWQYYQYMVINEDLEQAISEVVQIIQQAFGNKK
ncbi:MAG: guanylate kinase [Planctomycetota bacterium]|jgi:guanylate kinase